jgi:two-component system response regulator QseB
MILSRGASLNNTRSSAVDNAAHERERDAEMRLLMIEQDDMIAETVLSFMRRANYDIDWAADAPAAEMFLRRGAYDLVLIDLGTPRDTGAEILGTYRGMAGSAALLVIMGGDALDERVHDLDSGTDYLTKPFDIDDLAARVRQALLRRAGQTQPVFSHRMLTLDVVARVAMKDGMRLPLAPREFMLLLALIEEPERVFRLAELAERLYGRGREFGSNTVDAHVHCLRRKIGADEIKTIRGVGYRLKRSG